MRPVTPFMMMPTEWMVLSLVVWLMDMYGLGFRLVGALRTGSRRERRGLDASFGQCTVQLLPPVGDVTGGSVAVEHAQRCVPDVGQLVKDLVRDIDGLARVEGHALLAETHFAGAFDDEVDLLLFLVVPRHLAPVGLQRNVSD